MRQSALYREFTTYVTLNILGSLGLSCYILADTFFVASRLGADGLTALNLAISVFGLLNGLGMMLGIGGGARYSIFQAQGMEREANRTFTIAFLTGAGLGLFFALCGLFFARPLAVLLGAEGHILPMCATYLRTALSFAPFFILNQVMTAFVRNDGNPKLAMAAMLTGSLTNIVLDYVFLYPLDMGIFGAAFATGVAPVVGLLLSSLHILTGRSRFRLVREPMRPRHLFSLSALGGAAFLNECSTSVVLVVFNLLILHLAGNLGVAAYSIVANLAFVMLGIFNGISNGTQPLVSQACGRGDLPRQRTLYRMALILATVFGVGITALGLFAAPPLVALFNSAGDPALQSLAEGGMHLYFLGFLFVGFNLITASYLGATERPLPSSLLSFFRGFVGIVVLALCFGLLFGLTGVWLAFPAAELLTALAGAAVQRREFLRIQN